MNNAVEVYNYPRKLENELKRMESIPIKNNKQIIRRFHREIVAQGVGLGRQIKYLSTLRSISNKLGKDFEKVTKDDVIDFIGKLEQSNYSEWTKRDYRQILKRFYRWLYNKEDGYPEQVKWIRVRKSIKSSIRKKDLLSVEDIKKMSQCASHPRDRAFIWVYYESVRRLGEILNLNIGDLEFDEMGVRLNVNGKVGKAPARIVISAQLLTQWLEYHPDPDNPNAPLWVALNKKKISRLGYERAREVIRECAHKAGIKKRIWPYLIRHSRIDPLKNQLPYPLLLKTAGWSPDSDMPKFYFHMEEADVDEAHSILTGKKPVHDSPDNKIVPIPCPKCKTENVPGSRFCYQCGYKLDSKEEPELTTSCNTTNTFVSQII
ncbi:MAG: tyrosine-type recombinase/integrase [Candidatus Hodarchaeales archaeon]